MKKLLILLLLIASITVGLSQITNFFWGANNTSNKIHEYITVRMGTNTLYVTTNLINLTTNYIFDITNNPPFNTMFRGITTNTPVVQPGATNYWWFTNGILTLITNQPS